MHASFIVLNEALQCFHRGQPDRAVSVVPASTKLLLMVHIGGTSPVYAIIYNPIFMSMNFS